MCSRYYTGGCCTSRCAVDDVQVDVSHVRRMLYKWMCYRCYTSGCAIDVIRTDVIQADVVLST